MLKSLKLDRKAWKERKEILASNTHQNMKVGTIEGLSIFDVFNLVDGNDD